MKRNILNLIKENNEAGLLANIHQQTDVKFVDEAANIIGELRLLAKENKLIKDSEALMVDSPKGSQLIAKLEKILTDRFIVKSKASIKIMAALDFDVFSFPTTPETARSIIKNNNDKKSTSEFIEMLKTINSNGSSYISDLENDSFSVTSIDGYRRILKKLISDSRSLEKALKTGEVVFDLKNATVSNLPDDFNSIIAIDFFSFFEILNDKELVSVLCHEYGHCYTSLVDLYRKADGNIVLTDLMSSIDNDPKQSGAADKIFLTMKSELGIDTPNFNSKNASGEFIGYVSSIFDTAIKNKGMVKDDTVAEKLADQFAVRFGLEMELFNSLDKISKYDNNLRYKTSISTWDVSSFVGSITLIGLALSLVSLLFAMATGSIVAGFISVFVTILSVTVSIYISIGSFILYGLYRAVFGLLSYFSPGGSKRYVEDKRRLELIRNDLIRRLNKAAPKNKEERFALKSKFEDLESMDRTIDSIKANRSIISMIGQTFIPDYILDKIGATPLKISRSVVINNMLEDMKANRLQVLSEKIKLSGGL